VRVEVFKWQTSKPWRPNKECSEANRMGPEMDSEDLRRFGGPILPPRLFGEVRSEDGIARLKISDIDSKRMVVHIQEGKGGKDRDVMLSRPPLFWMAEW